jgi:Mg2+ and Co2+ transporter CorA
MQKEQLSKKLQKRIKMVKETDTYQLFKDIIDQALTDATTEEEFEDIVHNSIEDYVDQATKVQNILKGT